MEDFEYLQTVGEGAYGYVWKCRNNTTGSVVAIKGFKQAHMDVEIMRLAMREVRILKAIRHANCVRLEQAFKSLSGRVYLVFEYVPRSVFNVLERSPCGLSPSLLKLVAWQLLHAVAYLHGNQIVHRDVKPGNILLTDDNIVKLCDFGFARFTNCGQQAVQRLTSYVVTRWYRAPEVLVGDEYGPASDIWSLGCTLAELAAGRPLFPGSSTLDQLWLIMRCLGPLTQRQGVRCMADLRLRSLTVPKLYKTLRQRLPYVDASLLHLIQACLKFDPAQRPTAQHLLQLPYFWGIEQMVAGTPLERLYSSRAVAPKASAAAAAAAAAVVQPQPRSLPKHPIASLANGSPTPAAAAIATANAAASTVFSPPPALPATPESAAPAAGGGHCASATAMAAAAGGPPAGANLLAVVRPLRPASRVMAAVQQVQVQQQWQEQEVESVIDPAAVPSDSHQPSPPQASNPDMPPEGAPEVTNRPSGCRNLATAARSPAAAPLQQHASTAPASANEAPGPAPAGDATALTAPMPAPEPALVPGPGPAPETPASPFTVQSALSLQPPVLLPLLPPLAPADLSAHASTPLHQPIEPRAVDLGALASDPALSPLPLTGGATQASGGVLTAVHTMGSERSRAGTFPGMAACVPPNRERVSENGGSRRFLGPPSRGHSLLATTLAACATAREPLPPDISTHRYSCSQSLARIDPPAHSAGYGSAVPRFQRLSVGQQPHQNQNQNHHKRHQQQPVSFAARMSENGGMLFNSLRLAMGMSAGAGGSPSHTQHSSVFSRASTVGDTDVLGTLPEVDTPVGAPESRYAAHSGALPHRRPRLTMTGEAYPPVDPHAYETAPNSAASSMACSRNLAMGRSSRLHHAHSENLQAAHSMSGVLEDDMVPVGGRLQAASAFAAAAAAGAAGPASLPQLGSGAHGAATSARATAHNGQHVVRRASTFQMLRMPSASTSLQAHLQQQQQLLQHHSSTVDFVANTHNYPARNRICSSGSGASGRNSEDFCRRYSSSLAGGNTGSAQAAGSVRTSYSGTPRLVAGPSRLRGMHAACDMDPDLDRQDSGLQGPSSGMAGSPRTTPNCPVATLQSFHLGNGSCSTVKEDCPLHLDPGADTPDRRLPPLPAATPTLHGGWDMAELGLFGSPQSPTGSSRPAALLPFGSAGHGAGLPAVKAQGGGAGGGAALGPRSRTGLVALPEVVEHEPIMGANHRASSGAEQPCDVSGPLQTQLQRPQTQPDGIGKGKGDAGLSPHGAAAAAAWDQRTGAAAPGTNTHSGGAGFARRVKRGWKALRKALLPAACLAPAAKVA